MQYHCSSVHVVYMQIACTCFTKFQKKKKSFEILNVYEKKI